MGCEFKPENIKTQHDFGITCEGDYTTEERYAAFGEYQAHMAEKAEQEADEERLAKIDPRMRGLMETDPEEYAARQELSAQMSAYSETLEAEAQAINNEEGNTLSRSAAVRYFGKVASCLEGQSETAGLIPSEDNTLDDALNTCSDVSFDQLKPLEQTALMKFYASNPQENSQLVEELDAILREAAVIPMARHEM